MPPDNYRILPVLLEGFNLPSWNASQSWESAGAFFLIHATANGRWVQQLRIVILVHGYRCFI